MVAAAAFSGPVLSGAVFLLLPASPSTDTFDLPESYKPRHKGHVDLSTGLYIRENEDLVVAGAPALILRRTYLSRYQAVREFGVGTTHNGELFLIGERDRLTAAELIRADGSRIRFVRTTPGTSLFGAMFEHRETAGEWRGARLGWTGIHWALRRSDGSLMLFRGCLRPQVCSIIRERDAAGRVTHYRRDVSGRLMKIEAPDNRWIAFDYDVKNRIARAYTNDSREVRYEYDARSRLTTVTLSDGVRHRYTYTDRDEMATIVEPDTDIENKYDDNGRCVEQVNRYPDSDPYIFRFTYTTEKNRITQTDSVRSDGTWLRYTWGPAGQSTSEVWGAEGLQPAIFTYERDAMTGSVTGLTLTCPDRTGKPLRHSSFVKPGREDDVKRNLLTTHCSWSQWSSRRAKP